jgi:hypothetical protein
MPSEVREKPLPTPHPDYTRSPDSAHEGERPVPQGYEKTQEFHPVELEHDSYPDELDLMLDEPVSEPDPALASDSSLGARIRASRGDVTIPPFHDERKDQPGTSEVFEGVTSRSDEIAPARAGWGTRIFSRVLGGRPPRQSETSPPAPHEVESHGLGMWMSLVLLCYASVVTIALTWLIVTGRTIRDVPAADHATTRDAVEKPAKSTEPIPRENLPPIPIENVTYVGNSIRVGDVEVTPLAIQRAQVDLVHRIDSAEFHHEEVNSLVLRLRLRNVSKGDTFMPLARHLVREHVSALDRSFIVSREGNSIGPYPLAVESEWLIVGQEFPELQPGESAETLVASEPVNEDRIPEAMTWRVRLRIGLYRTDMLGVRFTRRELSQ